MTKTLPTGIQPMRFARLPRVIAIAAIASASFACSESVPAPATPTATVSHGVTALTLQPGGGGNIEFTVVRKDGHVGTVHFSVVDAPDGVIAAFSPASISGSASVSTLSVTVAVAMPSGSYTLQARVTGEGIPDRTIPITLTVLQPGISLSLSQAAATVEQQRSVSIPLTVSRRDGYTGPVGLTALDLPAGVTAQFEPTTLSPTETTSTLTLTASLATSITASPVTIRASGTGVIYSTSTVVVAVTPTTVPGVLLAPNPAVVQLRPGETVDATIDVRRFAGYDGVLTYELGTTPGITATVLPSENNLNAVVIRLLAAADASLGNRAVTLRATGDGIAAAATQFTAQVITHPTFGFSNNPVVTFTQGTTATDGLVVRLNRIGGFSEPVRLTAEAVPPGVSISPDLNGFEIPGSGLSGSFSYVAADNAAPGAHTFTLRGISTLTGKEASIAVPIVVRARGTYALGVLETTTISMPTVTNRIVDLTITRIGGFTGNITFSLVSGMPGVFSTFTPSTTSGNSVRMLIGTALGTTPRTFTVVVRGTSPGADPVELPFTITVTPQ